jgi:hypothetical protein
MLGISMTFKNSAVILISAILALSGCNGTGTPQQPKTTSSALDIEGQPLYQPKYCRRIYSEEDTAKNAAATMKRRLDSSGMAGIVVGVFQLNTGRYVGADTLIMDEYGRLMQRKGYAEIDRVLRYNALNRKDSSGKRCTRGDDLVRDTGMRIDYRRSSNGGLLVEMITGAANMAREGAKLESSSAPSSSGYCGSSDTCYSVVKAEPRKMTLQCTRGYKTGSTAEICANSDGRWASGCGATDMFAHHYDMGRAANIACGQ